MTTSPRADGARPRPGEVRVGVIGAGRVGAVLATALYRAGHDVVGVSVRTAAGRDRVAQLLPDVPVLEPHEVARASSLVILSLPDDVLGDPAGPVLDLVASGAIHARQVVAHTSGRYGLGVLGPVARAGAITLAVHPAQTFGGTADDLPRLPGVSYGVTALGRHWPVAEWLVAELGGTPVAVPEELRPLWHAGLAHGANHLVTLVASALDIVRATGASDPSAVLRPLLSAALERTLEQGDAALTGPVARGDADAVAGHLRAIDEHTPTQSPLYRDLALATAGRLIDPAPELWPVLRGQTPVAPPVVIDRPARVRRSS
ncbi:MAG TPA: DUF2520 domain-containing protein [Frankiaceae bacterium]|nr:DUF2520 domain-containing protein [Frankiaceae bacterium]